jgi:cell division protein FtsI/penicillin-binding protein 2
LKDFQFGKKSALKFAGESSGILPEFPLRGKVTITRVPIGYAEQVTALQLARGYSAIANRGMMPQLRLVDRVFDPVSGKMTKEPYWEKVRVLKHKETFDALVEMLISVTAVDGTGKRARIPGYDVAGKTGTCQMVINGLPSKEWYRASFCGFVPARNPELLMVVTVEGLHVSKPHGGGAVAAPVFQRTMSRVLKFLNVTPDRPEELVAEKNKKKK